jgi:hypothetical protein
MALLVDLMQLGLQGYLYQPKLGTGHFNREVGKSATGV